MNHEEAHPESCTCCGERPATLTPGVFEDYCGVCQSDVEAFMIRRMELERVMLKWARRQKIDRLALADIIQLAGIGAAERVRNDPEAN